MKKRNVLILGGALVVGSLAIPAIRAALADGRSITSPYSSGSATVSSTSVVTLTSAAVNMGNFTGGSPGYSRDIYAQLHFQCSNLSIYTTAATVGISVDTSSSIGSTENFDVYDQVSETVPGITDQTDLIHVTGLTAGAHTLYCLIQLAGTTSPSPTCSCEMIVWL